MRKYVSDEAIVVKFCEFLRAIDELAIMKNILCVEVDGDLLSRVHIGLMA